MEQMHLSYEYRVSSHDAQEDFGRVPGGYPNKRAQKTRLSVIHH